MVPNMEAGSSYLQTMRDALEGKRDEGEKKKGKEAKQEWIEAVQRTVRKAKEKSEEVIAEQVAKYKAEEEEETEMGKVDGRYERTRVGCQGASVLLTTSHR